MKINIAKLALQASNITHSIKMALQSSREKWLTQVKDRRVGKIKIVI